MKLFIDGSALLKRKEGYMEYTDGTLKYKVVNLANQSGGVPHGVILAFSGTFDTNGYPIDTATGTADTTWHLCDGTNGTPDLRGRFILGASASHATGTTGGEESHSLTPDENAPHDHDATCGKAGLHHHTFPLFKGSGSDHEGGVSNSYTTNSHGKGKTDDDGLHAHKITIGTSGKGTPHNNMPPFYTLSYIMKL